MALRARQIKFIVGLAILFVIILTIVLVSRSASTLEYYQYGFKKHLTQNVVDRSKPYGPGNLEWFGPSFTFLEMPAGAQFLEFQDVEVFAKDRLEVTISAELQYFLRKDQLSLLHKKYDVNFESVIRANALSSLKNKAPSFEVREYLRNRTLVERELFYAIREHISGSCCENNCTNTGSCIPGCKTLSCEERDYGFFVDVRYFQLQALDLPSGLKDKFLTTQILYEQANTETYIQEASVVRKTTESEVQQIKNEARQIREEAQAESVLVVSEANANKSALLENAKSAGQLHFFTALEITDAMEKMRFNYLRTLGMKENVKIAVDFDELRLTGN